MTILKRGMFLRTVAPLILVAAAGCASAAAESTDDASVGVSQSSLTSTEKAGKVLFTQEQFGGNGRTCNTCHLDETGTMNPAQVEELFAADPTGPLFRADGADFPGSGTFSRIRTHATIRVVIPLPPNVSIVGSAAREVPLLRGVPTTKNTPALDPVLMYDGRAPTLQLQARGAINAHAGSNDVTDAQLDLIAAYEKTQFNDGRVRQFAEKGRPLVLPAGTSDAEIRGRVFFTDDNPTKPRCIHCHSGPMLNETSPALQLLIGVPAGGRFLTAFVSEFNSIGNEPRTFRFTNPDGTFSDVTTPDPGLALTTGNPGTANLFKIPSLWGVKNTAPYFHDNSAADLPQLMRHYQAYFRAFGFNLTDGDAADITAYLQLL